MSLERKDHPSYADADAALAAELEESELEESELELEPWEIVSHGSDHYVQRADGSDLIPTRFYVLEHAREVVAALELEDANRKARG